MKQNLKKDYKSNLQSFLFDRGFVARGDIDDVCIYSLEGELVTFFPAKNLSSSFSKNVEYLDTLLFTANATRSDFHSFMDTKQPD